MAVNLNKIATKAGKGIQSFVEKTKTDVVKAIDQTGDGKFGVKDVQVIVGRVGDAIDDAKRRAEMNQLKPIFFDDISRPGFMLSKIIRIVEPDKRYYESTFCKAAIGYITVCGDVQIYSIFKDAIECFGLKFYPYMENDVYYVDPTDRNTYIELDQYYPYMKEKRVFELQRIAQTLGAKHFSVTFREKIHTVSKSNRSGSTQTKAASVASAGLTGQRTVDTSSSTVISIAADMEFLGHAPCAPELVYLRGETSIVNMIEMRMDPDSPLQSQHLTIEMSNSSGIKEKDAVKIDAALKSLKISGNVTMTSEAQAEAMKLLEYQIDF